MSKVRARASSGRIFLAALVFVAALGAMTADAWGEAPKKPTDVVPDSSAKKAPLDLGISQAALAAQLALEGEKRQSPILMLAAAELLGNLKEKSPEQKAVGVKEPKDEGPDKKPMKFNFQTLVEKAREFAKTDKQVSGLVENYVERLSSRGLVARQGQNLKDAQVQGRPFKVIATNSLDPGQTLMLQNVTFEAEKPAVIIVVGDGMGDLDLWVYDGNTGGMIGQDTDNTSRCVVQWVPRYEGPFNIRIKNVGRMAEQFVVLASW